MSRLESYTPKALAVLRIVSGLLFMQHGVQKLFMWPPSPHHPDPIPLFSFFGFAGILEFFGGLLIVIGLFTRPVAFLLAGEMAVGYWMFNFAIGIHMPNGWMPVVNGGDSPIQFCFVFLYLVFAGAGAWSIDAARRARITKAD